jgi:hypothetical protein
MWPGTYPTGNLANFHWPILFSSYDRQLPCFPILDVPEHRARYPLTKANVRLSVPFEMNLFVSHRKRAQALYGAPKKHAIALTTN